MRQTAAILLLSALTAAGCKWFSRPAAGEGETPVARAYGKELYLSEVRRAVNTSGLSASDSLRAAGRYIEAWLRREVLLHDAEESLAGEQEYINRQMEDYRASLLIYLYEKEALKHEMDTVIGQEEIAEYYQKNKQSFQSDQDLVQVLYVEMDEGLRGADSVRLWMKSPADEGKLRLENFAYRHQLNFNADDSLWIPLPDLLSRLSFRPAPAEFQKKDYYFQYHDYGNKLLYFFYVVNFSPKGSPAPASSVAGQIKKIILNKRKLELIAKKQEGAYEKAQKAHEVETY